MPNCNIFFFAAVMTLLLIYDEQNVVLYSFLASAAHEAGHILVMAGYGRTPKVIEFKAFGFHIESSAVNFKYSEDIVVSLAGVAVNFIIFTVLRCFSPYSLAAYVNLCIAAVNLLPVYPMDGYRVMYFMLCKRHDEAVAAKISNVVSIIVLVPVSVMAVYIFIRNGHNMSPLILAMYLFVCCTNNKRTHTS